MSKTSEYKKTKMNKYISNYKINLIKEVKNICLYEKRMIQKDKSLGDFTIGKINISIDNIIKQINMMELGI